MRGACQVPILLVQSLIVVSVTPLLLLLYPYNPNIVVIVSLHYFCQVVQDYIVTRRSPIYRRRFFHLYHPRIIHLCNVLEFSPSKRLIYKAFISLLFYFWSWFHNMLSSRIWKKIRRAMEIVAKQLVPTSFNNEVK